VQRVILIVTKIFIKVILHKTQQYEQALATKQEAESQVRILQQQKQQLSKHHIKGKVFR
jgi:uncharacterized protein YpmB